MALAKKFSVQKQQYTRCSLKNTLKLTNLRILSEDMKIEFTIILKILDH